MARPNVFPEDRWGFGFVKTGFIKSELFLLCSTFLKVERTGLIVTTCYIHILHTIEIEKKNMNDGAWNKKCKNLQILNLFFREE